MSLWKEKILDRVIDQHDRDPDNFLRADKRRNIQSLANSYWDEMLQSKFFIDEMLPNLPTETVGNPFKFKKDDRISPLTVQHLYHIFKMKTKSDFEFTDTDLIVEIGGGFGNLCRLAQHFGFKGEYVIVDFPEQSRIQEGFLRKSGADMSKISFMPLELEQIADKIKDAKHSSIIGTFSINEMPIEDRNHLEKYYDKFDYIFIIHNMSFDGIDNQQYFTDLKDNLSNDFKTQYFKDDYMRSWFLIGGK